MGARVVLVWLIASLAVLGLGNVADTDTLVHQIWVSPDGDSSAPGTPEAPLSSIQDALNDAGPGTAVILAEGSYGENVVIANSGEPGAPIQLQPAPGARAEIRVNQGEGIRITGSHVVVSGLIVTGINASEQNNYGYGILVEGRDQNNWDVVIANNTVSGFAIGGIAANWTNHILISENEVYGNSNWGPEGGSGISLLEPSAAGGEAVNRIVNNVVHDNAQLVPSTKIGFNEITDGNCIQLDRLNFGSGAGQSAEVLNNVSFNCGGRGLNIYQSSNVTVRNNVTWHNGTTAALRSEVYIEGENVDLIGNVFVPTEGNQVVVGTPTVDSENVVLDHTATLADAAACIGGHESPAESSEPAPAAPASTEESEEKPAPAAPAAPAAPEPVADSTTTTECVDPDACDITLSTVCPASPRLFETPTEPEPESGNWSTADWLLTGTMVWLVAFLSLLRRQARLDE